MDRRTTADASERYRREISRYQRISHDREEELSKTIQKGKPARKVEAAVQELVESNLFLVMHCARQFDSFVSSPSTSISRMDLIAEGNIALMTAARRYDAEFVSAHTNKRVRFAGYACNVIRNRMRRALKMAKLIHIPEQHFSYWSRMRTLESKHGGTVSDEVMMEEMDVGASKLKSLRQSLDLDVSRLEDLVQTDGESRWADTLADAKALSPEIEADHHDMESYLRTEMKRLPQRTRDMLNRVYLSEKGASLADLAEQYGVSRERCRQVLAHGLKTLRHQIEARHSSIEQMSAA